MAPKASRGLPVERSETMTTAIHLPRRTWELLREVAFSRARRQGGRASVSKVIVELVESARDEFTREAKPDN